MEPQDEARQRLTDAIEKRRAQLHLQLEEVAARMGRTGRSAAHLRRLRTGKAELNDMAKAELESALEWQKGSVDDILEGREPTPLTPPPAEAGAASTAFGPDAVAAALQALQQINETLQLEREERRQEREALSRQLSDMQAKLDRLEDKVVDANDHRNSA